MKRLFLILLICFFASLATVRAEEDKKQTDEKDKNLIHSLNLDSIDLAVQARETQVQEEVSVEAPEYPGLNISFDNPADSIRSYKPFTRQELQAYSDLLVDYQLTDYDRSETARPHKPARLFRTTISTDEQ